MKAYHFLKRHVCFFLILGYKTPEGKIYITSVPYSPQCLTKYILRRRFLNTCWEGCLSDGTETSPSTKPHIQVTTFIPEILPQFLPTYSCQSTLSYIWNNRELSVWQMSGLATQLPLSFVNAAIHQWGSSKRDESSPLLSPGLPTC